MKNVSLIIFVILTLSSLSFADKIYLKNGQLLEGEVVGEFKGRVWVKIQGGRVLFSKEEIESIEKEIPKEKKREGYEKLETDAGGQDILSLLAGAYYNVFDVFLEKLGITERRILKDCRLLRIKKYAFAMQIYKDFKRYKKGIASSDDPNDLERTTSNSELIFFKNGQGETVSIYFDALEENVSLNKALHKKDLKELKRCMGGRVSEDELSKMRRILLFPFKSMMKQEFLQEGSESFGYLSKLEDKYMRGLFIYPHSKNLEIEIRFEYNRINEPKILKMIDTIELN